MAEAMSHSPMVTWKRTYLISDKTRPTQTRHYEGFNVEAERMQHEITKSWTVLPAYRSRETPNSDFPTPFAMDVAPRSNLSFILHSQFFLCILICNKLPTGLNWLKMPNGKPEYWQKNAKCPCERWKDSFSKNLAKLPRHGLRSSGKSELLGGSKKGAGRKKSLRKSATGITRSFRADLKVIGDNPQLSMHKNTVEEDKCRDLFRIVAFRQMI
jgi:hypothetical protein